MWRAALVLLLLALGWVLGRAAVRGGAYVRFWAGVLVSLAVGIGPLLYILFGYRLQLCGSSDCGFLGGLFYAAGLGSLIFGAGWVVGGVLGMTHHRRARAE